jgi:ZIP family zinc transporter
MLLSFSASALIATACLILIPESIELGESIHTTQYLLMIMVGGFFVAFFASLLVQRHGHSHGHTHDVHVPEEPGYAGLAPASVSAHGIIDGLASGAALIALPTLALPVIAAISIHRIVDGMTVGPVLIRNDVSKRQVLIWSILTILSPLFGIALSQIITLNDSVLSIALAALAGLFLYVGASDILPETRHAHPKLSVIGASIIAVLAVYFLSGFE